MSFIIDTMDLIIRNPPVPTKLIPDFDPYGDVHTVLRIQEPGDNDTWIIDTTGCQYGYRDLLIPFDKYFMGKDFELLASPLPYNASETKDLDYYALVPCFTMSKAQRIGIRKERHTRHRFAAFVAKAVGDKFLEGSDAEFEETIDRFVDQLKTHMLSSIKATEHLTFDSDEEWNFSKIAR